MKATKYVGILGVVAKVVAFHPSDLCYVKYMKQAFLYLSILLH